jgi:tRNA (cytidine/uridine-2'-O-)-methyltransferase
MFEVVLYRPEIAPNTGNIIRLCAATGARLHLVEPLGFQLDDRRLRRAGLDYHEHATVVRHTSLAAAARALTGGQVWALSRHAACSLYAARFAPGDVLLFGNETSGLPADCGDTLPLAGYLRIPMRPGIRSLNLASAAAIVVYEALRQCRSATARDLAP